MVTLGTWVEGLGCQDLIQLCSGSPPSTPGVLLSSLVSTKAFLSGRHISRSVEWKFYGMLVGVGQGFRGQADLGLAGLSDADGASLPQGVVSGPQVYEQGGQSPSVTPV